MHRVCAFFLPLIFAAGCATEGSPNAATSQASCVSREAQTGSNIIKREPCTVVSDADREMNKQKAEALRDDQNRRAPSGVPYKP